MTCNKCGNILPDDSEFCQYCGVRIEKPAVIPEVDLAPVPDAVAAVSDAPVGRAAVSLDEEVILPLPNFENVEPAEAPKPIPVSHVQETIGTVNADRHRPPNNEGAMNVVPVPPKAPKVKKVKQPKRKYCSRCGSLIDPQTKQCTGCGKKYFKGIRFNKFTAAIMALSLVIVALIGLNIFQCFNRFRFNEELHKEQIKVENLELENENLEKKNEDLRRKVADLQTTVNNQRTTVQIYREEAEDLRDRNEFYYAFFCFCDDYVEVIGDDGTNMCHKYGCKKLDMSEGFWILNTDAAKYEGYIQCQQCHD